MKYKYSVVIPTRNRQRYCVEAIKTITRSDRDDVTIIIPDNSDDDSLRQMLIEENLFERVNYLPPENRVLPMDDNWERAIDLIDAEWVIYIGDDDGFTPSTLDAFDFLTEKYAFQVYSWLSYHYKWPCFPTTEAGYLSFSLKELQVTIVDTNEKIKEDLEWKTTDKWPSLGPSVYHGLVNYSLIKEIKDNYEKYFVDPCVDYASGILNASRIKNYLYYSHPLTVTGACGSSNTAHMTGRSPQKNRKEVREFYKINIKELKHSELLAALVVESFARIFSYLKMPFSLSAEKIVASCLTELARKREPAIFNKAKEALLKYAKHNNINTEQIKSLVCREGFIPLGFMKELNAVYIDTNKFNVYGTYELTQVLESLSLPFKSDRRHILLYEIIKKNLNEHVRT